jgi:hypothetical protein
MAGMHPIRRRSGQTRRHRIEMDVTCQPLEIGNEFNDFLETFGYTYVFL